MINNIFKKMFDKVRSTTQKNQVSETYFMDERQIPLVTEKPETIEEEVVSTKEVDTEERKSKIYSGSSTWNFDSDILEPSAMFTKGLPKKGDTLTIEHFQ
tara:strand:- start:239 stop:538 length:300 start_codon:yes stop_codon:yes gene_type:complete